MLLNAESHGQVPYVLQLYHAADRHDQQLQLGSAIERAIQELKQVASSAAEVPGASRWGKVKGLVDELRKERLAAKVKIEQSSSRWFRLNICTVTMLLLFVLLLC